jgi:hypothetical protein
MEEAAVAEKFGIILTEDVRENVDIEQIFNLLNF